MNKSIEQTILLKRFSSFLISNTIELFIVFAFVFSVNNYLGNVETIIKSDGLGYYEYLPSLFIHHDFVRKDSPAHKDSLMYKRINGLWQYVVYEDYMLNKFAVGTAVLQLPFFLYTYWTTDLEDNYNDGYQQAFHRTIFHATIFYLFLGLFFFRKILELYNIEKHIIIIMQILLVFATSITNYANFDASYSHVYSFFAITAFMFLVKSYFLSLNFRYLLWAGLLMGLILILRQVNVLIILFIPFLAGSLKNLKLGINHIFKHPLIAATSLLLTVLMFSIQSMAWFLQVGNPVVYSYKGEGFNFLDPNFIGVLFGYKTGLFVYSPILLISSLSTFIFVYKRQFYLISTWFIFFLISTYIFSSWWSWYYGCSYGLRVYLDFLACFFIPFSIMLNGMKRTMKFSLLLFSMLCIPLNMIQTYQYKDYILHWIDMDKEKYWKIFLKTDDRYSGLVWKEYVDYGNYQTIKKINKEDIHMGKYETQLIFNLNSVDIERFPETDIIHISFENDFKEIYNTKVLVSVLEPETKEINLWHEHYLIHYQEEGFNKWQKGVFYYKLRPFNEVKNWNIKVIFSTQDEDIILKNIQIAFLNHI